MHENNGLFLFSEDPRELRQYIDLIIEENELLGKMRENARRLVIGSLSYDIIASQSIEPTRTKDI